MSYFRPIVSNIDSALNTLNELFGEIIYSELPSGNDWIDHLDILDAIRINQFGRFKSIEEGYANMLNGISVVGIKKKSRMNIIKLKIFYKKTSYLSPKS